MVNGSPTLKLTAESPDLSASTRESKQILLPLPFPGQHADFHDYGKLLYDTISIRFPVVFKINISFKAVFIKKYNKYECCVG
jgi:hypothetical protein